MSDAEATGGTVLHECPCCRKLVPESHFRRAPISEEDLTVILSHPRFEKRVLALLGSWAAKQPKPKMLKKKGGSKVAVAPPGYITYADAVKRFDYSYGGILSLVSQKRLIGGDGIVLLSSIIGHQRTYRPKMSHRGPRQMKMQPGDMSNADAAKLLGVSGRKLLNMKNRGMIEPGIAWGSCSRTSIEQYMKKHPPTSR